VSARRRWPVAALAILSTRVLADGTAIDKVYHPYVDPLEWEAEWRMILQDEDPATGQNRRQLHRLGLGRAVSEFVFAELYLIGAKSADDKLDLYAYEAEVLWQLSEQGEFFIDYGLLFELEKEHQEEAWEAAATVLLEKEFGSFSGTANLGLIYEWGNDIRDEWETSLALQGRYRYSPRFEPALELYSGENTRALGPVLMGMEKFAPMKALRWEMGVIFGLDSETADYTVRALLEYEF
jgi:hypothetical protein